MLLILLFAAGYLGIAFEHSLKLNKSASALLTGVACWTVVVVEGDPHAVTIGLDHQLAEIAGILFFLLGAMTIVDLVDAHDGFALITSRIHTRSRRKLLLTVSLLSFFLSAVLDNLTTSIVMMSLVRKLVGGDDDRMYFGGAVIIAANSGGAWSPIGDVTTTMLWIGGQITPASIIQKTLLPALVSVLVPVSLMMLRLKGNCERPPAARDAGTADAVATTPVERNLVFFAGVGMLLFVPVFKLLTHLPPFMGILLGLGVLWALTELIHKRKPNDRRGALSVTGALQRIDSQSILFFLGILLAIGALQHAGLLAGLAHEMDARLGNIDLVTIAIGLASAVVDNVPLVAAAKGMYPLATYGADHHFWTFLAYCAGTGGSILIIGSAAGVAVMGIQQISFGWYLKRISLLALLGYASGALLYLATMNL